MPQIDRSDPVVTTRVEVRLFCPAELRRAGPSRPPVPDDAELRANASGVEWLAAELGWSAQLEALMADARAACSRQEARR